jgi:hypothetical protein
MTQVHDRFNCRCEVLDGLNDPVLCLAANLRLRVTSILDIGVMPLRCNVNLLLRLKLSSM